MSRTAQEKIFNKKYKESIKKRLEIDDAEFKFWSQIESIQSRKSITLEDRKYRKKELDSAIEKFGETLLDQNKYPIVKPIIDTKTKDTKTKNRKYKTALKHYYQKIYDTLDAYKSSIKASSSTEEKVVTVESPAVTVESPVISKDLLKILTDFIKENKNFRYSDSQMQKIESLNSEIKKFYKDPTQYIIEAPKMRFEQLEGEIAIYRAKIEEYRQFLQSHDPIYQSDKIKTKLEDLHELRAKAISKAEEDLFDEEIQVYKGFQLLCTLQQELKPEEFLANDDWGYERAHFKLEQDERVIYDIHQSLSTQLNKVLTPEEKTALQEQVKFYRNVLQYFETEKNKGKWPSYEGFIASQAPITPFSIETYRSEQLKIINNTLKSYKDPQIQVVLKSLTEACQNYQSEVSVQAQEDAKADVQIASILKALKSKLEQDQDNQNLKDQTLLFMKIQSYFELEKQRGRQPSLEGFMAPRFSKIMNKTYQEQLKERQETLSQVEELYDNGVLNDPEGKNQACLKKLISACKKYATLTVVDIHKDSFQIQLIVTELELKLKDETDKNSKRELNEQIGFYKSFLKYIDSETNREQVPTYEGFLASQASTLFLSKDDRDQYRKEFIAKIPEFSEDTSTERNDVLTKLTLASNGFPHSTLRPRHPSTYDRQIVPVYTQYLKSFAKSDGAVDLIAFSGDKDFSSISTSPEFSAYISMEYPDKEERKSYENIAISSRLMVITGQEQESSWMIWIIQQKKKISEKDQMTTDLFQSLKDKEKEFNKFKELYQEYEKAPNDEQIIQSLKTLLMTSLKGEWDENSGQSEPELKALFEEKIESINKEIQTAKKDKGELQSQLIEVEHLMNAHKKISETKAPLESTIFYSSPRNPIKSVTYFNGNLASIKLEEPKELQAYGFQRPLLSDYARIEYKDGAILDLCQNGEIRVPKLEGNDKLDSEDEFVFQTLKQFEKITGQKELKINFSDDYSEGDKVRIFKKLVYQYSVDENGKINKDKYKEIKMALLRSGSVKYFDIENKTAYDFLKVVGYYQETFSHFLPSLIAGTHLKKGEMYQEALKSRQQEKKIEILSPDMVKEVSASTALQHLRQNLFNQRQVQKQWTVDQFKNILNRNWNALPKIFSSNHDTKEIQHQLDIIIHVGTKDDFEKAQQDLGSHTKDQKKLNAAIQFFRDKLHPALTQEKVDQELERIRNEKRFEPKI